MQSQWLMENTYGEGGDLVASVAVETKALSSTPGVPDPKPCPDRKALIANTRTHVARRAIRAREGSHFDPMCLQCGFHRLQTFAEIPVRLPKLRSQGFDLV